MLLFDPTTHLHCLTLPSWFDQASFFSNPWGEVGYLFAQQIEDPDLLGNLQRSWKNFVETGQIWALGIGFVLGYMFRSFTSF